MQHRKPKLNPKTILQPVPKLELVIVDTKALLDTFIDLPNHLHQDDPNWTVPLRMERRALLDPKKNPYFDHAEACFWLARRGGQWVGRISAQIDQMSIAERGEPIGHFGMLVCEDNAQTATTLLTAAENWLRSREMTKVQGPMNLSINQEVGLMTSGYDTPSMMLMPHDKPFMRKLISDAGYAPAVKMLAYIRDANTLFPEKLRKLAERRSGGKVHLRKLNMKNYAQEIETLVSIFNEGWHTNWGFVPMTQAEVGHMADELRPIIDPNMACFAEIDGEAAAFLICLPDVNGIIRGLNGKLLPFGWLKLLWRLKIRGPKTARVLLMGVRKKHSAGMLGNLLPFRMIYFIEPYLKKSALEKVEMSWILEDNKPVRHLIEALGGEAYKEYEVFEKTL